MRGCGVAPPNNCQHNRRNQHHHNNNNIINNNEGKNLKIKNLIGVIKKVTIIDVLNKNHNSNNNRKYRTRKEKESLETEVRKNIVRSYLRNLIRDYGEIASSSNRHKDPKTIKNKKLLSLITIIELLRLKVVSVVFFLIFEIIILHINILNIVKLSSDSQVRREKNCLLLYYRLFISSNTIF